jgi:hypothetical protein
MTSRLGRRAPFMARIDRWLEVFQCYQRAGSKPDRIPMQLMNEILWRIGN